MNLQAIVVKKPINVDNPVTEPPIWNASGSIVSAIIVSIAPAASPSIRARYEWLTFAKKMFPAIAPTPVSNMIVVHINNIFIFENF
jgi:hypothetical protein